MEDRKLIVNLEGMCLKETAKWAAETRPFVDGIMLGGVLGADWRCSPVIDNIQRVVMQRGGSTTEIYVNSCLFGPPERVRADVKFLKELGADYVTVAAQSGIDSVRAAVEAGLGVIAVLVPWWISDDDLPQGLTRIRYAGSLAWSMDSAGVSGIVCNGDDIEHLGNIRPCMIYDVRLPWDVDVRLSRDMIVPRDMIDCLESGVVTTVSHPEIYNPACRWYVAGSTLFGRGGDPLVRLKELGSRLGFS